MSTTDTSLAVPTSVGLSGTPVPTIYANTLEADTISEYTAAAGVTIDGMLVKDSGLTPTGTLDVSGGTLTLPTGTWTPGLSFATPGDQNIVLSTAAGKYAKFGSMVKATAWVQTSTFTHATAAGALTVTNLPFTVANDTADWTNYGVLVAEGWTQASAVTLAVIAQPNTTHCFIAYSRSGATYVQGSGPADWPSGGTVKLFFTVHYYV